MTKVRLTADQRRMIQRSLALGHGPLFAQAIMWDTTEAGLLRVAGLSREEYERRWVMRRDICRYGVDAEEADRRVAAAMGENLREENQ